MSEVIGVEEGWKAAAFGHEYQYEDVAMAISRGQFPLNYSSSGYEISALVKTGAGSLYGFTVRTSRASAQFIQLFDAGKVPAASAVPRAVFDIAATSTLGVTFGQIGRRFWTGIVIVNSTTANAYTAGSADCFFDVQYV